MILPVRNSAQVACVAALALLAVQSGQSVSTGDATAALARREAIADLARLEKSLHAKQYREAAAQSTALPALLARLHDPLLEIRFARYTGAIQLSLNRYREALKILLPGRELAAKSGDFLDLWAIDGNLAWVYLEMNNLEAAKMFAERAVDEAGRAHERNPRPLISLAFINAKLGDFKTAERQFSYAIDTSLDLGDVDMASMAWHLLGDSYLESLHDASPAVRADRLGRAEVAETEAFRLRKTHHFTDLDQSCRELARILAERHDYRTATVLMDEAVNTMGSSKSTAPIWFFFASRGQLRAMQGDLAGALPDLRAALELAQRLQVIPTDDDRVALESGLADLYSDFIDVGNRLYLRNHDPALKAEVFEAAEANRASSLLALTPQPGGWRSRLPARHGEIVAQMEDAERDQLANPGVEANAKVKMLRASLHEIEARAGADEGTGTSSALAIATRAVDGDSAIIAFHLSDRSSWVWTITQDTFAVSPLPPKPELIAPIEAFQSAVRKGDPHWRTLSEEFGRKLLGNLPASAYTKHRWIIVFDQELFQLPVSALSWNGRLLIEDHSLLLAPGVRYLLPADRVAPIAGPLLGVGDAIYNSADRRAANVHFFGSRTSRENQLHLARLAATKDEVWSARDAWGSGNVLTGRAAVKPRLFDALAQDPAILHLATHVVASPDRSGVIVLGIDSSGRPGLLGLREVLSHSIQTSLVVMSGCSSGDAQALPASGLLGLTRAWLGAGALEVLATRWPTLDDNGPFFRDFYSFLKLNNRQGASEALRQAQLAMAHSAGFRNSPEFWASYFLIGKV